MKLVGIVGSPREGSTQYLVSEALGAFESAARSAKVPVEVEMICLRDKHIEGCRSCDSCERTGTCVIEDDAQAIYE